MKKNIIKTIAFLLILCILLCIVFHILWLEPTSISYFYKEPKDSLDVVYIGSSNAYVHFNTVFAYDLYGYTTGLLSTDSQPFGLVRFLIEESQKYQNPSLYVIDIAKLADTLDTFSEEDIRKTLDSMKFSKNRINAINQVLNYKSDIDKEDYVNFYLSFLLYHNRWKDISNDNITGNKDLYKGYLLTDCTIKTETQDKFIWNNGKIELPKENRDILIDLINYIKERDLNVLFVVPIRHFNDNLNKRLNTAIKIIQENELNVINFNTLSDFTVDFSIDLYNENHINVYGATKYTLYFAKYLKENYNLPDHRNDKNYSSWDKEYQRFKASYKELTENNFDELLKEYIK